MLNTVENWSTEELKHALGHPTQLVFPNKAAVLGDLHNYIGNAYFELGHDRKALFHYERDLEIANKRWVNFTLAHIELLTSSVVLIASFKMSASRDFQQFSLNTY